MSDRNDPFHPPRRTHALLLSILVCAALAAACGGDETEPSTDAGGTEDTVQDAGGDATSDVPTNDTADGASDAPPSTDAEDTGQADTETADTSDPGGLACGIPPASDGCVSCRRTFCRGPYETAFGTVTNPTEPNGLCADVLRCIQSCDCDGDDPQACGEACQESGDAECNQAAAAAFECEADFCLEDCSGEVEAECGDGFIDGDEECDGTELPFRDCADAGFDSGTVRCTDTCELDLSRCVGDPGSPIECFFSSSGFVGGTVSDACIECMDEGCGDAMEAAFGTRSYPPSAPGGACEGFLECLAACECGSNRCYRSCEEDVSGTCQDATLAWIACSGGTCGDSCDESSGTCGDGAIDADEDCEGDVFLTCGDLGFDSGELSCGDDCTYDTTRCVGERGFCGDGRVQFALGEACDGEPLGTCEDRGYDGGEVVCTDECAEDESGCELTVTRDDATCSSPADLAALATATGGGGLRLEDTTDGASAAIDSFCGGFGREVVYRWTPSTSGEWTIIVDVEEGDDGPAFDGPNPSVNVRTDCDDEMSEVGCNDDDLTSDDFTYDSRLEVELEAGTTYFLIVDTFDLRSSGAFVLEVMAP